MSAPIEPTGADGHKAPGLRMIVLRMLCRPMILTIGPYTRPWCGGYAVAR